MRRLLLTFIALMLSVFGALVGPRLAEAAPLAAAYSGAAGGDVLAFDLGVLGGVGLTGARLAVSQSTVNGGTTPASTATAADLAGPVVGLPVNG